MRKSKAPAGMTLEAQDVPGKTRDRVLTDMVAHGVVTNAATAARFVSVDLAGVSLTDMVASLQAQGEAVNRGDLGDGERMLSAQAVALNAIFAELARVAHANLFTVPDVADRYLRLALRAQSQSRATVETLAAIKNPPVLFARQANIAHGPQQVNNGTPAPRAGECVSVPTELFEDRTHGRTQLDPGATPAAGRAHPQLVPVEALDRPEER